MSSPVKRRSERGVQHLRERSYSPVEGGITRRRAREREVESGSLAVVAHTQPSRQRSSMTPAKLVCISREWKPVCAQFRCPWLESNTASGPASVSSEFCFCFFDCIPNREPPVKWITFPQSLARTWRGACRVFRKAGCRSLSDLPTSSRLQSRRP